MLSIEPNMIPFVAAGLVLLATSLGVFERFVWNCQHADMALAAGDTPPSVLTGLGLALVQRLVLAVVVGFLGFLIGKASNDISYGLFALGFVCIYELGLAAQYLICGSTVVKGIKRNRAA